MKNKFNIKNNPPSSTYYLGNCLEIMAELPTSSIDMVFADPPYNLQLGEGLTRPDSSIVNGVNEEWDTFKSYREYDKFTFSWLKEIKRILKPKGTIWVIGTYHNIFRIGKTIQDLGYWILNDITWRKSNPMPNFRGTRFTNAHETLIWAQHSKKESYTFNYRAMKALNEDLQMRSDWLIGICSGQERIKNSKGKKAHPTQKPEALLHRIILSSTNPKDLILDPFFGSGTTGSVAKKLGRKFIGIEQNKDYLRIAKQRINAINKPSENTLKVTTSSRNLPRIPFGMLVENGMLKPGSILNDESGEHTALVRADGSISSKNFSGSIHNVAASIKGLPSCNGWLFWHFKDRENNILIDKLRKSIREKYLNEIT